LVPAVAPVSPTIQRKLIISTRLASACRDRCIRKTRVLMSLANANSNQILIAYRFSGVTGKYIALRLMVLQDPVSARVHLLLQMQSHPNYSVAREITEKNQYAWSAGTRINVQLRNGLAFRLGLLYDQAGDVFDYTDTLATHSYLSIDSFWAGMVHSYILTPPGCSFLER
jgi:hypothetical protein